MTAVSSTGRGKTKVGRYPVFLKFICNTGSTQRDLEGGVGETMDIAHEGT